MQVGKWFLKSTLWGEIAPLMEHLCVTLYLQDSPRPSVPQPMLRWANFWPIPIVGAKKTEGSGKWIAGNSTMTQQQKTELEPELPVWCLRALSLHMVLSFNFLGQRCYIHSNQSCKQFPETSCSKLCPLLFPFANPYPLMHVFRKFK